MLRQHSFVSFIIRKPNFMTESPLVPVGSASLAAGRNSGFYTPADLRSLEIAAGPSSILNLQRNYGFPQFVKIGRSALVPRREVHEWYEKQLRDNRYPVSKAAPKGGRPRGLPHLQKSKFVLLDDAPE